MTTPTRFGFRIVGDCSQPRRLVDHQAAFDAYAACDGRAEVDKEAYLSAFTFGDDFKTYMKDHDSTKGYAGSCWSSWLWFDIDSPSIDDALAHARRLAAWISDRYGLDDDALLLFYSGSKCFHVGLPTSLWGPAPAVDFHRRCRAMAERLAERAGVRIDVGVYDRVRAFRAPNSKHPKTGRHKRRLSFDELLHLSTDAIVKLAETPEAFDLPRPPAMQTQAVEDWRSAGESLERQAAATMERRTTGSATLNRQTLEFIKEGAATGDRHRLLFSSASNLAEFGCPPMLAHALLTEAGLDSGLSPQEVRRQIDCGLAHVGPVEAIPSEPTSTKTEPTPTVDPQLAATLAAAWNRAGTTTTKPTNDRPAESRPTPPANASGPARVEGVKNGVVYECYLGNLAYGTERWRPVGETDWRPMHEAGGMFAGQPTD